MTLREFCQDQLHSETSDARVNNCLMSPGLQVVDEEKFILRRLLTQLEAVSILEQYFGGASISLSEWGWGFKHSTDLVSVVQVAPLQDKNYTYFWVWLCKIDPDQAR